MYINFKQNIYCIFQRDQKKKKKKKIRPTYPHLQTLGRQLQTNNFLRMALQSTMFFDLENKKIAELIILKLKITRPFRCFKFYMSQINHVEITKKKHNFKFYFILYLFIFFKERFLKFGFNKYNFN